MAKITVADWRAYAADPEWDPDLYVEYEIITVLDRPGGFELSGDQNMDDAYLASLPQEAEVTVSGVVCSTRATNFDDDKDLEAEVKKFIRKRDCQTFVVEIPKEDIKSFRHLMSVHRKWKVL
jgi:hypothetical protein